MAAAEIIRKETIEDDYRTTTFTEIKLPKKES